MISFAESYGAYIVGGIIGTFFAGEKIEKGLEVWPKLFDRLKATFHREPTFDREGASILVTNEIISQMKLTPNSIKLNGFKVIDMVSENVVNTLPEPMPLEFIGPTQQDKISNRDVYYFDIEVNGRRFVARVYSTEVKVIELL